MLVLLLVRQIFWISCEIYYEEKKKRVILLNENQVKLIYRFFLPFYSLGVCFLWVRTGRLAAMP